MFTVSLEDAAPNAPQNYSLPYNMTEDPWMAAQRFLTRNGLPQSHLEQVHEFIVTNTQSVSMSQQTADSNYRDPFTGM